MVETSNLLTVVTKYGEVEKIDSDVFDGWFDSDVPRERVPDHVSLEDAASTSDLLMVVNEDRRYFRIHPSVFHTFYCEMFYSESFVDVAEWYEEALEQEEIVSGLYRRVMDLEKTVELSGDDYDKAAVQAKWDEIVRDAMEPLGHCSDIISVINDVFIANVNKKLILKVYIQSHPGAFRNLYDWCMKACDLSCTLIIKPEFVTMESDVLEELENIKGAYSFFMEHITQVGVDLPQRRRKRKRTSEARRLQEDVYDDPDVAAMAELTKGGIKTRRRFYKRE
jgi:hypothetical protein